MKKIILINLFLFLFLLPISSFANDIEEVTTISSEYTLPYPGILPDSSLYFLKAARDKIVSFLISDPVKKAEFNLITADKRLNAGLYLVDKGKITLAEETISKGENYLEEAVSKASDAKKQGILIDDILRRLKLSLEKHSEVIVEIGQKAPVNLKKNFQNLNTKVMSIKERVNKLKLTVK